MGRLGFSPNTTIKEAYAAMANNSEFFINDGVSIFVVKPVLTIWGQNPPWN